MTGKLRRLAIAAALLGGLTVAATSAVSAAGTIGGAVFTDSSFELADGSCRAALPTGFTLSSSWSASPVSSDGSRIVLFQSGLYVVDLASRGATRVSSFLNETSNPSWSPDGTQVVFQANDSGANVIVSAADGSSVALLAGGTWPAWSPTDDQAVAFLQSAGLVIADPADPSAPFTHIGTASFGFDWLPDGSGFVLGRLDPQQSQRSQLWYASEDGSVTRQITTGDGTPRYPKVSPDGSRVLFANWRWTPDGLGGQWLYQTLYAVGIDGTGLVRLEPTELPTGPSEVTFWVQHYDWLDDTHIAYGANGDMVIRDLTTSDPLVPLAADQDWVWSSPIRPLCAPEGTFSSEGVHDGWVLEKDETSAKGGTLDAAATTARVGDDALDRQYRSILSFDTSALPDDAVITGVTLRIKRGSVTGKNPILTHGLLKVDMRTGFFHDIQALEKYDFQAPGSRGNVGRFIKVMDDGWYRAPLRAPSYGRINLVGTTEFRLLFDLDDNDDLGADYLAFYSGNAAEANRPELIVNYYIP